MHICRGHFVYAPSQWEMMLQCNTISHWLCAYTKLSQHMCHGLAPVLSGHCLNNWQLLNLLQTEPRGTNIFCMNVSASSQIFIMVQETWYDNIRITSCSSANFITSPQINNRQCENYVWIPMAYLIDPYDWEYRNHNEILYDTYQLESVKPDITPGCKLH